jgi:gamma-glutamyltranspeptidase/glutathione hydrolase
MLILSRFSLFTTALLLLMSTVVYGEVQAVAAEQTIAEKIISENISPPIIRYDSIHQPIKADRGMVATQHYLATEVGRDILGQGGNAVDAAVAVGFSLAVVLPRAGNLGGGGFMLVHLAEENKTIALDYREVAPKVAHRDLFLDENGEVDKKKARFSRAAAGVPGTVAGLVHAQAQWGKLSLKKVMAPAIKLADKGFAISGDLANQLAGSKHLKYNEETRRIFFKEDGSAYLMGETLRQKDLAWSLKQISRYGSEAFYKGNIAEKIVEDMAANDGLITAEDLGAYKIVERPVVKGTYRGFEVASMPPPSSGGVHLIQMLNTLENFPLREWEANSSITLHHMVESMKWAYADRSKHLGDPDFVPVPVARLIAKDYAASIAAKIDPEQATPASVIHPSEFEEDESRDTTHYSIMDVEGNAVSNTYTLNFSFGSGISVPGTGILLNNEMDDFSAKPGVPNAYGLVGGEFNAIAAGKRPLSSMTPTILFKDGAPYMVTGSPGGSRIITAVLQSILNVVDHQMNIAESVHQPRIHHQWRPDITAVEPGFSPDTLGVLYHFGHNVSQTRTMGSVNAILWDGDVFYGVADPRKPDASAGGL